MAKKSTEKPSADKAPKKIKLFDFLSDVGYDKQYLFDRSTQSEYVPFMINKGLAQHLDTVMLAAEMNKFPNIDKEMHHDFMFYAVSPRKRYGKWAKSDSSQDDQIAAVQQAFDCNRSVAIRYLTVLTDDEVKAIESQVTRKSQ